jgi:hypothetical protein
LERKFIPCLVTNLKLTPTSYKGNHSYIDGTEVAYYPTKGFEILIPIPLASIKNLDSNVAVRALSRKKVRVHHLTLSSNPTPDHPFSLSEPKISSNSTIKISHFHKKCSSYQMTGVS